MFPRNTDTLPACFKLPRCVAAARTRSYKRIRRALINRRYGVRYSRLVNGEPSNAMRWTKVERAADPFGRAFIARSTVKATRACLSVRNASARCPPEATNCPRSGKRCKRSDNRTARVPQRPSFLVWEDDLAFADFNSDFDPLWPAAAPLRGRLHLCGVGRNLR
jgi:hypothetical protein